MGGSTNVSTSSSQSQPLTADQRSAIFQGAMQNMSQTNPSYITGTGGTPAVYDDQGNVVTPGSGTSYSLNAPQYVAPTYQSAGTPQQISGGDLQQMQKDMTAGYTAPLDAAKATDITNENSDLAKRGIWSSGLAEQAMGDINKQYAPQYAQAGANATNAAYGLSNSQNQSVNSLAQQNANSANNFNITNAAQQNASNWAPLNYLQGLWNGTGGQTSSSNSFSFGLSGGVGGGT